MNTYDLPTWDLSDLYESITDPKLEKDVTTLTSRATAFETSYRGTIKETISPETLADILNEYSSIVSGMQKIEAYAYLTHSTHTGREAYGAFFQHISTKMSSLRSHLIFLETSLIELPDAVLHILVGSKEVAAYKHFLEKKINEKKHRLPELAENILQQKSLSGRQAFIRLQDQNMTGQTIPVQTDGKKEKLSVSSLLNILYDPNRELRKQASKKIAAIAKRTLPESTFIYNTLMQDFSIDASLRSFQKSEDMRHLENEVERASVDSMSEMVTSSYSLVHEYYKFKEQVLSIGPLYEYDRYAPMNQGNKTYSFNEAKDMVLEAFHAFSPEYADVARLFFEKRWIDAPSTDQKRHGAFCMYVTPDTHPFILLNYHGGRRDVSTLAHELGHGIHAYLARQQNILQFDWPITIAETASIFGEMILFKHMLRNTTDDTEKLVLIMEKIEEMFATIFRQISMYQFEQAAHTLRLTQGELTTKQLNSLWTKQQRAMFGKGLTITGNEAPFWSLIPHIFHTPFYVYSYAFGELLTLSLFSLYEKSPNDFPQQYIDFLSAGGSKSPQDLVSIFNVDIRKESFWKEGIAELSALIQTAKTLKI